MPISHIPSNPARPWALLATALAASTLLAACGGGGHNESESSGASVTTADAGDAQSTAATTIFETPGAAAAAALGVDEKSAQQLLDAAEGTSTGIHSATSLAASSPRASLYDQVVSCMQAYVDKHNLKDLDYLGWDQLFSCNQVGSYRGTMRLTLAGSKADVADWRATQDPEVSCRVWYLPKGLTVGWTGSKAWYRWNPTSQTVDARFDPRPKLYVGTYPPESVTPRVKVGAYIGDPMGWDHLQFCQGVLNP